MNVHGLWIIVCTISNVYGVSLEFDGLVDLEKKWNYKYNISRSIVIPESYLSASNEHHIGTSQESFENIRYKIRHDAPRLNKHRDQNIIKRSFENATQKYNIREETHTKGKSSNRNEYTKTTHLYDYMKGKVITKPYKGQIFVNGSLVKQNSTINHFIEHVYEQALKLFDKINQLIGNSDKDLKTQVELLQRIYKTQFGNYINITKKHTIKTHLGAEKVLKNIVDTSNNLLQRLFNALDDRKYDAIIKNEINKLGELEKIHLCKKFQICRTNEEFFDFVLAVLLEMRLFSDDKLRHAVDTATEYFKNANYRNVLDKKTQKQFRKFMNEIEMKPQSDLREIINFLVRVISRKNHPIVLYTDATPTKEKKKIVVNTVLFRELIYIFDKNLANNNKYKEWEEIKSQIKDFSNGDTRYNREVMSEAMKKLVNCFKEIAKTVDRKTAKKINDIIKELLKARLKNRS